MSRSEQVDRIAPQFVAHVLMEMACEKCKAVFTTPTNGVCQAAYRAVDDGWRVDKDGAPYCPNCAQAKGLTWGLT